LFVYLTYLNHYFDNLYLINLVIPSTRKERGYRNKLKTYPSTNIKGATSLISKRRG